MKGSNDLKKLIMKLLTVDPKERITAKNALKDPWFKIAKTGKRFSLKNPSNKSFLSSKLRRTEESNIKKI